VPKDNFIDRLSSVFGSGKHASPPASDELSEDDSGPDDFLNDKLDDDWGKEVDDFDDDDDLMMDDDLISDKKDNDDAEYSMERLKSHISYLSRREDLSHVVTKNPDIDLPKDPPDAGTLNEELRHLDSVLQTFTRRKRQSNFVGTYDDQLAAKICELRYLLSGKISKDFSNDQMAAISAIEHDAGYEKDRADTYNDELSRVRNLVNRYKKDVQIGRAAHSISYEVAEHLHKQVTKIIANHPRMDELVSDVPGLRKNIRDALVKAGVKTLRDLCLLPRRDFLDFYGVGEGAAGQLSVWLDDNALPNFIGSEWTEFDPRGFIHHGDMQALMLDLDYEWKLPSAVMMDSTLEFSLNDYERNGLRIAASYAPDSSEVTQNDDLLKPSQDDVMSCLSSVRDTIRNRPRLK